MIGTLLVTLLFSCSSSLISAELMEAKSKMYLRLDEPRDLLIEPYRLYEVYVPLSQLKANE